MNVLSLSIVRANHFILVQEISTLAQAWQLKVVMSRQELVVTEYCLSNPNQVCYFFTSVEQDLHGGLIMQEGVVHQVSCNLVRLDQCLAPGYQDLTCSHAAPNQFIGPPLSLVAPKSKKYLDINHKIQSIYQLAEI